MNRDEIEQKLDDYKDFLQRWDASGPLVAGAKTPSYLMRQSEQMKSALIAEFDRLTAELGKAYEIIGRMFDEADTKILDAFREDEENENNDEG